MLIDRCAALKHGERLRPATPLTKTSTKVDRVDILPKGLVHLSTLSTPHTPLGVVWG